MKTIIPLKMKENPYLKFKTSNVLQFETYFLSFSGTMDFEYVNTYSFISSGTFSDDI